MQFFSERITTDDIPIVHRTSNAPFAKIAEVMNASPAFRAVSQYVIYPYTMI